MRRGTDRFLLTSTIVCLLCALIAAGVSVTVLDQNHKLNQTIDRIELASLGVCHRLQLQRERANLSDARQYLILRQVLRSPRLTPQARREYRSFVSSTEYGPPTDCRRAVDDPPNYRALPFIPFDAIERHHPGFAEEIVAAAIDSRPQPTP